MSLYPVNLNIKDKRCLVIGGGKVAQRKVATLLDFGADVVVVSPELCPKLETLASENQIELHKREYRSEDLEGAFLAFAATDNRQTQAKITEDAKKCRVLLNNATAPDECDFQVPAHFRRGELQVAISTSGASPAVSRMLREKLENSFGDEYEYAICLLRLIRQRIVTMDSVSAENKEVLRNLLQDDIVGSIEQQNWMELQNLLKNNLPADLDVEELLEEFRDICMA